MTINRRRFLQTGLAFAAYSSFVPGKLHAAIEDHHKIANIVRRSFQSSKPLVIVYPEGCLANLQPIIKSFLSDTGVEVKAIPAHIDYITSELLLAKRIRSNLGSFDLALPPSFSIPDLVEDGTIVELSSFEKKYQNLSQREKILYRLGSDYLDKFYGYQCDGDCYFLFFNDSFMKSQRLADAYAQTNGFKLTIPETWQELDRQIKFFHRPKESLYGGSLFRIKGYVGWEFFARFHAKGYYPLSDDFRPQFNNEAGLEALSEMIETTRFLHPGSCRLSFVENIKLFAKGQIYACLGWGGSQKFMQFPESKVMGKLLHAALPGIASDSGKVTMPLFNWGWNYVVSAASQRQELAYLFSLYASTTEMSKQAVRVKEGFFDPFRSEHYQDQKIKETYGESFLSVHEKALVDAIPDLYIAKQGLYKSAMEEGLLAALNGYLRPQQALNLIAEKWERLTDQYGREKQLAQWAFIKKSYPVHVKKVLR